MASQLQKVEEWVKNSTAEERASPYGKGMLKAYVRLKREAQEEKDKAVQISEPQREVSLPEDDASIGGIVGGMGAEIAISTAGKYGGAAVGTAILPGVGTAIGYAVGAIGSGIAGSFAAQKAEGRDTLSWGRAAYDTERWKARQLVQLRLKLHLLLIKVRWRALVKLLLMQA
jgi:hypothetical protein